MSENVERNPDEGLRVGRRLTAQGSIAKSILINNAYLLAHRFFAEHVARRLCQAARDDLFEITSVPSVPERKRLAAVRGWTKRWHVGTVRVRQWAVGQLAIYDLVGPGERGEALAAAAIGIERHYVDRADVRILDPRSFATRRSYLHALQSWGQEQWHSSRLMEANETTPGHKINEHCEWLARYQVNRETFSEIARSVGMSRQSVTEATKNVALLLDLPLRSATPGGRPKK